MLAVRISVLASIRVCMVGEWYEYPGSDQQWFPSSKWECLVLMPTQLCCKHEYMPGKKAVQASGVNG